jgi:LTXXQ motif family protein
MRRHVLLTVGLVAAATILPGAAEAQFPFSPRGFLGAVTAPLRGMLDRMPRSSVHRHRPSRSVEANRAAPPEQQDQEQDQAKLGWVGPLAWPTAYEDVVGYTLWPNDYGEDFRQHGFGDIVATIVGPLKAPAPTIVGTTRPETVGAAPSSNGCDSNTAAQSDWPGVQVAQTITLTPEQKTALDKLQAASAEAVKTIKAGCIDAAQRPPTQRLPELEQRLWQVQNAGSIIRAPLKAFYDSLTPEQKAKFAVQTPAPQDTRGDPRAANAAMGRQAQACAAQGAGDADRLIKQIQQAVRPTPQQRAGLEAFGKASSDMAKLLIASCAQPTPADPVARLDAADSRLVAMNYAATNVDVALSAFYGGLTDEQKARFDTLGK